MAEYYKICPSVSLTPTTSDTELTVSDYDKHRETLVFDDAEEGWAPEMRRYLGSMQRGIKKDSDIVQWWQVSF
jgi:hypothetical protein